MEPSVLGGVFFAYSFGDGVFLPCVFLGILGDFIAGSYLDRTFEEGVLV